MAIDSTSDGSRMVVVHTFGREAEGEALEALLRENGIQVMIRRSEDSVFDGLLLNQESGNTILVLEEDVGKSKLLIEDYLQSIPRESVDDTETLQWKSDLATKQIRINLVVMWLFCPCLAAFGLWALMRANGAGGGLVGFIIIALAIALFLGARTQRGLDQKMVSRVNRKSK